MENVVDLKLNYDDGGAVEVQKKQIDLIQQQIKYHKELKAAADKTFANAAQVQSEYTTVIKDSLEQLKAEDLQLKKTSLAADLYSGAIDKLTDNLGTFKNAGLRAIEGLNGFASGMIASVRGATGFVKVLKLVRAAIISTGIGALVIAITGVVTALLRVESVGKSVRATFAGLSNAFDAFTGRLATVGQAVIGLVTGTKSLGQAAREAGSAFKGVGKEMSQAFTAGKNLQIGYEALNTRARELSVSIAENEKRLASLTATANDETKSTSARIKATQGAAAIEKRILNDQLALERERLRLQNEEIANRGRLGTTEDLENQRAETLVRIKNIQADLISQSAEYRGAVNSLKDAEAQRLAKLSEAYQNILGELDQRLSKASSSGLAGIEKLLAERDAALAELTNFQTQIEAAAAAAGVQVPESVKQQLAGLAKAIDDEFRLAADKYRAENPFDAVGAIIPLADKEKARDIEAIIRENTERAARAAVDAATRARPLFQKIKDELLRALKVTEAELDTVVGFLEQGISQIDDIFIASTQVQIAQTEALIQVTQKRVDNAQSAYQKELDLQKQGLANSAGLREKELADEQRRLEDAQQKRQELERKALRQQLIADATAQGSQLALAASKVLSAEAPKGLPGILLAAAGIALIFKIIAAARANAAKSAQASIPKFRKGGKLEGLPHEMGGIPIFTNGVQIAEAEGGEFIVSKKHTRPNERFLDNLNKGAYEGIDLNKAVEQAQRQELVYRFSQMASTGNKISKNLVHQEALREEKRNSKLEEKVDKLTKTVENVLEALEERPVITPLDTPYKRTYKKRRETVFQIVRPKK